MSSESSHSGSAEDAGVDAGLPASRSGREDWAAVLAALEGLVADRGALAGLDDDIRERLLKAGGALARPDRQERAAYRKARRRRRRDERRAGDEAVLDLTAIRNQRIALVYPTPEPPEAQAVTDNGDSDSVCDGSRQVDSVGRVHSARSCYICKTDYHDVHVFYDSLCPRCAAFNHDKRSQSADLSGRVALLTGGRVKIGYQAGIKLLRAGAELIVTTRFPRDAATRYAAEPDFDMWRERLQIHGLDLRHTPSVEALSRHLLERAGRLDFVINNACQTVRRPPGFYAHLMEGEALPYDELAAPTRQLLSAHEALRQAHRRLADGTTGVAPSCNAPRDDAPRDDAPRDDAPRDDAACADATRDDAACADATRDDAPGALESGVATLRDGVAADDSGADHPAGLTLSAALSQVMLVAGDDDTGAQLFPAETLDADLQQVDLRTRNSWRLALDEVPTIELLEVHLVNAVAPFVLAARLKPLMLATTNRDKHIVNVSAMEGQFYRSFKTDKHPHTNMAKASLNMLTRTSAPDYQRDGIHMNSVDTGWITDEDPAHITKQKREEHGFHPPLDHVDAAARILDPIFVGMVTGEHVWGQFLKDYKPAPW